MADETVPAPEQKNSLDAWLDAEEARTSTRVVDMGKPAVSTEPVALAPETPPAEPEVPPTPEPVVEPETPPETPETPEVDEPEDPETPELEAREPKPPTRPRWKDVREADKRAKEADRRSLELEREIAYLRGRQEAQPQQVQTPPPAPEIPDEDLDPITKLERHTQRLETELQQLRSQQAVQGMERSIVEQEMAFERTHPEYRSALKHFVDNKREEVTETGELDAIAEDLRARNRQGVLDEAIRRNVTEQEAAKDLAFGVLMLGERNKIIEGARRTGKNVAEVIWNRAARQGFKGNGTAAPPPVTRETPKPSPQALKDAANSLSAVPRSQTPPPPRQIKSRAELLALPPEQLDKLIEENDRQFGNGWLENLA